MNAKERTRLNPRLRVLLIALLIFAALSALVTVLSLKYRSRPVTPIAVPKAGESHDAPTPKATATPSVEPSPTDYKN